MPPKQPSPSEGPLKEAPLAAAKAPPQETDAEKDAKAKLARIIANTQRTLSVESASKSAISDREWVEKEQKARAAQEKAQAPPELTQEQRFDYAQSMINYNTKYITLKGGSMPEGMAEKAQKDIDNYTKKPTEANLLKLEESAKDMKDEAAERGAWPVKEAKLPFPENTQKPEERFANAEFEIKNNIRSIRAKAGSEPPGIGEMAKTAIEEYKKNPTNENLEAVETAASMVQITKDDPQKTLKILEEKDKKSKK